MNLRCGDSVMHRFLLIVNDAKLVFSRMSSKVIHLVQYGNFR
jgi:hypothetical protein